MTQTESVVRKYYNTPGISIQQCFGILGVTFEGMYVRKNAQKSGTTIYDRISSEDLREFAEKGYKQKAREYHPDLHLTEKEHWQEEFIKVNEAYKKALKCIRRHRIYEDAMNYAEH